MQHTNNCYRHKRIHDAQKDGENLPPNYEEDIDNSENQFGSLKEDDSGEITEQQQQQAPPPPPPQHQQMYMGSALAPPPLSDMPVMAGLGAPGMGMAPPPQMMVPENY